jgi:NADPH:quinone reductase
MTMHAAVYRRGGGPEVLHLEEVPDPETGDRDVLVSVHAISIEGGDVQRRRWAQPTDHPHVVGYSASGVVESVGGAVERVRPGDRVATFNWSGSHAELVSVPEDFAFPVPDGVDLAVAATVPVAFGTADDSLFEFPRLRAGEVVFVRGATGGVGVAAVQLARAAGAVVVATGPERAAAVRGLGADHVVDGRSTDLADHLRQLTDGHGVDVMVDLVGGEQLPGLVEAMAVRGRLSVAGLAAGGFATLDLGTLLPRRLSAFGVLLGQEMHEPRVHAMVDRHLRAIAAGRLTMPIDRTFPLADAAGAHAHVDGGRPLGRVLILP